MAVFGDLRDFAFPDLLRTMMRKTGVLSVSAVVADGEHSYDLFMEEGVLLGMRHNREEVIEIFRIHELFGRLCRMNAGAFIFVHEPDTTPMRSVRIRLDHLLLASVGDNFQIQCREEMLPSPFQKFRLNKDAQTQVSQILDQFLTRSRELLMQGATPVLIARQTKLSVQTVRLYLFKLQVLGHVEPIKVQAAAMTKTRRIPISAPPANLQAKKTSTSVGRFIDFLNKLRSGNKSPQVQPRA